MKFRCYRCCVVMRDGIPPLEALSAEQSVEVGASDVDVNRHNRLDGTPYEGMSIYQFCEFCIVIINDFSSLLIGVDGHAIENLTYNRRVSMGCPDPDFKSMVACECGWSFYAPTTDYSYDDVIMVRMCTMHKARVMYPNADFSMLEETVLSGGIDKYIS